MKQKILSFLLTICLVASSLSICSVTVAADEPVSDETIANRIDELYNLLNGKYFNISQDLSCGAKAPPYNHGCKNCDTTQIVKAQWFRDMFGTVSSSQFVSSARSCVGFAWFAEWYIFRANDSDTVGRDKIFEGIEFNYKNVKNNAHIGDYFWLGGQHAVIYISCDSNGITVLDCNGSGDYNCLVQKRTILYNKYSKFNISRCYSITNGRANASLVPSPDIPQNPEKYDDHTHTNGAYFYSDSHPHYKFYTCTTCGEVYTDGSTTNMSACSVCNPKPNTYTVTFNPDGGECSVDTMQTNADGKLSSLPVATRSNCTFGGWRMIAGGSEPWRDVDTNTVFTKDTRVHAFWIYEPCTVFFNANGGTVSQGSKTVTAGTLYGDLPTPTRNGYKFDGWYTKASGGIRMTSNTGVESTVDHTLYAHWSDDPTPPTWSAWSAWSSTPYIASSTRQVETQQVKVSDAYTEYRYGRYVDGTGRNAGFCTTTLTKLGYSGMTVQYSAWTTSQYPAKEKDWTCGFCSGSHTGVHHYSNDGRAWWKEYVSPQSGSFFWEESRQTDAVYETQYRYRDLISG